jgi:hypothetical protein
VTYATFNGSNCDLQNYEEKMKSPEPGSERSKILQVLREIGGSAGPKEVISEAEKMGVELDYDSIRGTMPDMVKEGLLQKDGHGEYLPGAQLPNRLISYPYFPEGLGAGDETLPVDHGDKMQVSEQFLRAELGRVPPPSKAYWTRVNGESMEPYLQDGSPILVKRVEDGVEAAGRYALLMDDVGGVVKRCERVGSETLRVASDNPSFPTRIYTHQGNEHYEDKEGNILKIRVEGRVVYPRDTPHAMQEKAIQDIARALRQSSI